MLPKLTARRAAQLLETYSLQDLLEQADLTEADVLVVLVEQGLLELPETQPL
jgi:hypothetical protein